MNDAKRTLLVGLVLFPFGCSSASNLNIGNTSGTSGTGTPQLAQYAGNWDGHAEAYSFGSDGSDRVRLTLDATGQGTIQVGDATLAPATDPNVGYPPGVNVPLGGPGADGGFREGYPYPLHATRVEAGRLQFGVNGLDLFSGWCALQTSYPQARVTLADGSVATQYGCVPSAPQGGSTGSLDAVDGGADCAIVAADGSIVETLDCGKLYLCAYPSSVCACTESSCTAGGSLPAGTVPAGYSVNWDGALDATPNTMTATLVLNASSRVTVHLTLQ